MSDTQVPKTASQSEAFLALVEAIGDALYIMLSDEAELTEDEAEAFNADVNEVAFFAFDVFDPQIISTETTKSGAKQFVFQMTIPEGDIFDIIQARYADLEGDDSDDDEAENDE